MHVDKGDKGTPCEVAGLLHSWVLGQPERRRCRVQGSETLAPREPPRKACVARGQLEEEVDTGCYPQIGLGAALGRARQNQLDPDRAARSGRYTS